MATSRPAEPLAARLRPQTLDEVVGQRHIVGPGRLLRRSIEADQLSSVIFYGPPGTGKTTLARVIANTTAGRFVAINAVLAGVKDIRQAVAEAKEHREGLYGKRTILFVDEVHRFNKSQQDALLPWVEDGTLILVGATTENPYFEVNKALVSRSRLFRVQPLTPDDLRAVVHRALTASAGYCHLQVELATDAVDHLVDVANGDARALLNALELAVETTDPSPDGVRHIDLAVAEESIQRRAVLYDREGDAHFDTISAFIKSIRGSDPDAALYWLARMVYAGEDPRYIFRRLVVLASEDVGLADPTVVAGVLACAQSFDRIGMPEGRFPLAQATLLLASAPKSNSTMGFFDALRAVAEERTGDVPTHLKDPSRDKKSFGHGEGYMYPHAYRDHWVAQQYLPEGLQGRVFWRPSDQGFEGRIRGDVERRREAQLAAMVDPVTEPLSWSPTSRGEERWLQRAVGQQGARLEAVREAVFAVADVQRHHLVADLNAGTGLLLWEAVRRAPEGHVWARVDDARGAGALAELGRGLPELRRPPVVEGPLADLVEVAAAQGVRFDRLVQRDGLDPATWGTWSQHVAALLAPGGCAVAAQAVPRLSQRLVAVAVSGEHGDATAWREAEEAVYAALEGPELAWTVAELHAGLAHPELTVQVEAVRLAGELTVTTAMVDRWLSTEAGSWRSRVAAGLADDPSGLWAAVRSLGGKTVPWTTTVARVVMDRRA